MPITSPPPGYQLDRPGTSGKAVGPELAIINEQGGLMTKGDIGRIGVRGPPCFTGYKIEGVNVRLLQFWEGSWGS
jgi:non-ribosomal peptide synthetase component E (peptide arylation enzyme)